MTLKKKIRDYLFIASCAIEFIKLKLPNLDGDKATQTKFSTMASPVNTTFNQKNYKKTNKL